MVKFQILNYLRESSGILEYFMIFTRLHVFVCRTVARLSSTAVAARVARCRLIGAARGRTGTALPGVVEGWSATGPTDGSTGDAYTGVVGGWWWWWCHSLSTIFPVAALHTNVVGSGRSGGFEPSSYDENVLPGSVGEA